MLFNTQNWIFKDCFYGFIYSRDQRKERDRKTIDGQTDAFTMIDFAAEMFVTSAVAFVALGGA